MNGQNNPSNKPDGAGHRLPSTDPPKPSDTPKADPATATRLQEVKEKMTAFERSTLRWAKVAVIMSALAAIFVCLQWWEMHSGSADTHDLAIAAGKQADAAKAQSEQAKAQTEKMAESLGKTDDLIRQATEQSKATNALALATKRSAEIAEQALKSNIDSAWEDRRPWVGLQSSECLQCSFNNDTLIIGRLVGVIANTGRTPAIKMNIQMGMSINAKRKEPIPDVDQISSRNEEMMSKLKENLTPDEIADLEANTRELFEQSVLAPYSTRSISGVVPWGETNS